LSLILSLLSGAGVFSFLRALIFSTGFFVIGSLLYWMVKRFLPELIVSDDDLSNLNMGSQVDISLGENEPSLQEALRQRIEGDSPEAALGVEGLERLEGSGSQKDKSGSSENGGFMGEEFPAILDQGGETDYTGKDTTEGFKPLVFPSLEIPPDTGVAGSQQGRAEQSVSEVSLPPEGIDTLATLPVTDPDSLSQSSLPSIDDDFVPAESGSGTPVSVAFPGVDRKGVSSEGAVEEFRGKAKESAMAIQTLLKRD
jgi:hypothetical protein